MVRGVRWRPWSDDTKRLSHDFVVAFFYSNLIDTNSSMLEGGQDGHSPIAGAIVGPQRPGWALGSFTL
eukprot:scaffold7905_cov62-Phaeocystis_antarctica.AAC.3